VSDGSPWPAPETQCRLSLERPYCGA
jgi:hypothetical protein